MVSNAKRTILFILFVGIAAAMAFVPLFNLFHRGRPADYYSHIPLIPVISAFLLFRLRKIILQSEGRSLIPGIVTMAGGIGLFSWGQFSQFDFVGHAAISTAAAIVFLAGSYLMLFGTKAFTKALFPFVFLLFAIPLPTFLMDKIVSVLAVASTGVTHLLFKAFGVPFVQEGAYFHLPVFNIEVAQECSGIRSSIALLITTVLAGHIFLKKSWKRVSLALAVFPVTVLKNGIRIVTLYLLSYFVDMRIIEGGFLHKSGGFIFFGFGLVVLGFILWVIKGADHLKLNDYL